LEAPAVQLWSYCTNQPTNVAPFPSIEASATSFCLDEDMCASDIAQLLLLGRDE
jgi:hypothetical protein